MLRGERYAPGCRDGFAEIVQDIRDWTFTGALDFYTDVVPGLNERELALLGCNDRFFLLSTLLNRKDVVHPWLYDRCREVEREPDGYLDLWSRYHYKDLDVNTPILTPTGWTTHGELKPGDYVFTPAGAPTKVLATKRFTDSACYRITLDNDISFVCGAGHLWTVEVSSRKRVPGTWAAGTPKRFPRETRTIRTEDLGALKSLYRPVIRATLPLQMPRADLPIDPYVLGVWLGDGSNYDGRVCGLDDQVFVELERRGCRLSRSHCIKRHPFRLSTVYGLTAQLRALNLLHNKHIPEAYMLASAEQRLALLQGLIDTDGNASPINGCITFAQKDRGLSEQVRTLANSLGFKARLTPARLTESWHVVFQASRDQAPCLLLRKLTALPENTRRIGSQGWRIHSVEPVATVETNCIQVESEANLYLAGRELIPTHNSTLITFAGSIQEIICDPEVKIAIFAATNKIAKPFLAQIKGELEDNARLKSLYADVLWQEPKKEASMWSIDRGIAVKRKGNPREPTVGAYGLIDGMPTGFHFDILTYDDLVTIELVTNPDMVKKTTERWEMSDNLGVGASRTRKRHAGTRYSFNDSYGILLERGSLIPRIYPATKNGQLDGEPVFMSQEDWDKVKRDQRSTAAAQMLQNPLAGKGGTFDPHTLRPYLMRPRVLNVYIMGDPSMGSRAKTSDRTAIAVIGVDSAGNKYLLDGYCHRMRLSERWQNLRNLYQRWFNAPGIQNVSVGWERYGLQADVEHFNICMLEKDAPNFAITELNWTREGNESKEARVQRLEPDFTQSKFFVPMKVWRPDASWVKDGQPQHGPRTCIWEVDEETGKVIYRPLQLDPERANRPVELKAEREARRDGEAFRIIEAIRRRDEDGAMYDMTRMFFEEFMFFPFTPHDDLIDAISRIYDMSPEPAQTIDAKYLSLPEYSD